jgi:hypothetical protein
MRRAPNIDPNPHAQPGVGHDQPITRYPDEPHPNDEFVWKSYWVKKMFPPKKPLTEGDLVLLDQWYKETLAGWYGASGKI